MIYLSVGLLLIGWIVNTPAGLLGKADAIGYAVCHRISSHSFYLGDRPLPLCARCSGMYLGAILGIVYLGLTSKRKSVLSGKILFSILGLFILAFILDGINSFLSLIFSSWQLYHPANWLRLLTGTGMGLTISVALFATFNQTVWMQPDSQPVINGVKSLSILLVLAILLVILVIRSSWIMLYFFAITSAFGVVVLLSMIYTMIMILILKKENRINQFSQLTPYLMAGFGLALLQIILLDSVRFLLTGTWDGFYFG